MRRLPIFILSLCFMFSSCQTEDNIHPQKIQLSDNQWKVQSSDKISDSGETITSAEVDTNHWYNGMVPSTVMGVLTQNGFYKDILTGMNYQEVDTTLFNHSWWYRKEFDLPLLTEKQHALICFNGLSYSANVWLNGQQIASRNELYGPFRQFSLDITPHLAAKNVLAMEVFRAKPGDFNISFGDGNPRPADQSMGIFSEIYIKICDKVEIKHPYVHTKINVPALTDAWLTLEATLKNHTPRKVKGNLVGRFEDREFTYPVTLGPGEEKLVTLTSHEIEQFYVKNPRVWWCNNLGSPEMYELQLHFETGGKVSDSDTIPFGIREIKEYFIADKHRGLMLNGKKVLIKGAGWTDDIFLRDTPQTNEIQVKYVKDMNLNAIRLKGLWGNSQNIYHLCDRYGILALVDIITPNHPSVIASGYPDIKKSGPYQYVGPNYWYEDTRYGGAFGFNAETGIGAQLPVIESLKRIIPEDKLWPVNEYWNYHCSESMKSLDVLTETIEKKYGKANDLNDYLRKADLLNYESTKAMFEAFRVNVPHTTGVVQWMLNSAWPSLYWQLYDYFLIPTAAYYGVKRGNMPQQLIYNYQDNSIYYVNEGITPVERKARIAFYGPDSEMLHEANIDFRVELDLSKKVFQLDSIAGNGFLSLELYDKKGTFIARNFYCLSGQKDSYDWENTDWSRTPLTEHADFTVLATMNEAILEINPTVEVEGNDYHVKVDILNKSNAISLMTRLVLRNKNGEVVFPVFWDDNYVSIVPGETQSVNFKVHNAIIGASDVNLFVSAWNMPENKVVLSWQPVYN